jgi:DNA repair protein SbcD/Mre11
MARFIHAADLHLGRVLHGQRLLEDQQHALDQLRSHVATHRPHALLLAGDIYDRAVPPKQAVELLDGFLSDVVLGLEVPVVLIAGNHDSAERIGFGARLLQSRGLHIAGTLEATPTPLVVQDDHGPVEVFALPFLEPARVKAKLDDDNVHDQQTAMAAMVARVHAASQHPRRVLVAHAFVDGGLASDSERPLCIGGAEVVGADLFEGFAYTALGHLHRPQPVGPGAVHYAGSLLKYSLNEIEQPKSFTMVEIGPDGAAVVQRLALEPLRDLRRIQGTLADLLAVAPQGPPGDWVVATLLDKGPVFDAMAKLRQHYPHILHIERPELELDHDIQLPASDHAQLALDQLFTSFFEQVTGDPLSEPEAVALQAAVAKLHEREVAR